MNGKLVQVKRTTARLGELRQPQRRVVRRDLFKRNIAVPLRRALLLLGARLPPLFFLLVATVLVALFQVKLVVLHGADGADLGILPAQVPLRVEDRVDVQARRGGTAREPAEAQDEFLLELVGQAVLGAEEDDASLGD